MILCISMDEMYENGWITCIVFYFCTLHIESAILNISIVEVLLH